ncbi:KPN_02809 family neutral zinc metallopeptidase [Parasphingopyxis marina]|uniref:Neutral zinc metallopeptidase n=1 Tax=Parasphingopyxis marina TaxID=2761622 RepID=A0A842HW28_9SPHN|nr:neutral zinc metallopeptidase [Parasphingopyxis marina]MBC2776561.1 neutral zinc metallopeptidase [Parasphingopyxis marina]
MRLGGRRTSSNIERQTGGGRGGGFRLPGGMGGGGGLPLPSSGRGQLGCGSIAFIVIIFLVMSYMGGGVGGLGLTDGSGGPAGGGEVTRGEQAIQDETDRFVAQVLASTEDRWGEIFAERGERYQPATLVFYDNRGSSGCGAADSAMGPFYCPADQKIYLDTAFFNQMRTDLGAGGDFAQAYVVAHEVGHHIQTITGISSRVRQQQQRASREEGNALQVRMELQADCYAGVWANRERDAMEPGDFEEGMRAAQAIGDDTLQQAAQGYTVPESFTHGTSAQRQRWLRRGIESGDPAQCDTFRTNRL